MSTADLHKLITTPDRQWFGHLTLENFDAVAQRMEKLTVHERKTYEDGPHAHLSVCDTYGVWGLSTSVPDDKAAYERRGRAWKAAGEDERRTGEWEDKGLTWVKIERGRYDAGRIEITHFAPAGHRLYWVIAVEPEPEPEVQS